MTLRPHPQMHLGWLSWQVLEPAIELAEGGFPVSKVTAHLWKAGVPQLLGGGLHGADMLINGTRAPLPGEIFTNPHLAGAAD